MHLKTVLLVALLVPELSIAGGTLGTDELRPLLDQMPVVRDLLRSSLRLSESAWAEVRLGPGFKHLSADRVGPYTIDARSVSNGKPVVVVLCTRARFLDRKGRELGDNHMFEAVSIDEKLTGVMLREGSDVPAGQLCQSS